MLAEAQAVDHQRAHAAGGLQGAYQWVEERRGEIVGYPKR